MLLKENMEWDSVGRRLKHHSELQRNALKTKNSRRQMFQLHKLSSERMFLLEMKRKYAGIELLQ